MAKVFKNNKTKYTLLMIIVLALVILIIGATVSYAAYTHSLHTQRTIAPDDSTERFSSNYLSSNQNNVKTIYMDPNSQAEPATIVTVCNYPQGKQIHTNNNDVSYNLTAALYKYNSGWVAMTAQDVGSKTVTITKNGEAPQTLNSSNLSLSLNSELEKDKISSDVFNVSFSTSCMDENIYVYMVARPSDNSLSTLYGYFKVTERQSELTTSWIGEFLETGSANSYDGYNYSISGTGTGTVSLSWNTTIVELSFISLGEILALDNASYDVVGDICTVSFDVDSEVQNHFEFQFFNKNVTTSTFNFITFTFV